MNIILSILMTVVSVVMSIINGLTGGSFQKEKTIDNNYPCVFVHGFMGFGDGTGAGDTVAYWGGGSCDVVEEMNKMGYDCCAADIGPLSSNWDRACELYAQLTGTRTDYGAAHSKEHNHARYGKTYEKALVPNWGKSNGKGGIVKINLIGHSFGGNTSRLLLSLLVDGDKTEQAATRDGSLSPLFKGGKKNLVNSVTTIASPNNGTTLVYVGKQLLLLKPVERMFYFLAETADNTHLSQVFDFHLEQFKIERKPLEPKLAYIIRATEYMNKCCKNDSAFYDLSPEGAAQLNERCKTEKNVYYYAVSLCATKENKRGNQEPIDTAFGLIKPFCRLIGQYKVNRATDFEIDESWLPNDGMVNTISERNPFDEKFTEFDYGMNAKPGIWNVFPVRTGDHGYAVGLGDKRANVLEYFTKLVDQINSKG